MKPENYIQSLSSFPTLLSVCTTLVSFSCKYIYHGKRSSLTDSSVARHTTNRTLRLELVSRNQNGLRHDQGTWIEAEVRNIEYSIALKIKLTI